MAAVLSSGGEAGSRELWRVNCQHWACEAPATVTYTLIRMSDSRRWTPIFYSLWTLLSLGSSLPVLGMIVGSAAWNGVNLAVGLYLFLSLAGVAGLFVGFFAAFSHKMVLAWVTCAGAITLAGLSVILGYGFIFYRVRTRGVPWSDPLYIGGLHAPLIVLYGVTLVCCSAEALLYFRIASKPRAL